MKPSIDEVLSAITKLLGRKNGIQGVSVEELIAEMNSYAGYIIPSLLLLARRKQINMRSANTGLMVMLCDGDIAI